VTNQLLNGSGSVRIGYTAVLYPDVTISLPHVIKQ